MWYNRSGVGIVCARSPILGGKSLLNPSTKRRIKRVGLDSTSKVFSDELF